jgi:predicted nucleic acid-binding protein
MSKIIIGDTSFWIGLFIQGDGYHNSSKEIYDLNCDTSTFLVPWPTMYETLRTHFVRNYNAVKRFEKELKRISFIKYGDRKIREKALEEVFETNGTHLSLTDAVIREIIRSGKTNINSIITSNKKDFIDVCQKFKVDIHELSLA